MKGAGRVRCCCLLGAGSAAKLRLPPGSSAMLPAVHCQATRSLTSNSSTSSRAASEPQRTAATATTARDPIDVTSYSLYANHRPTSLFQKGLLAAGSALAAIINPERADMIATLGETTGPSALRALHARMTAHPVGREILQTKPRITEDTLEFEKLLALPEDTLGGAYARWMRGHEFTPDERPAVRFVDDPELAYVMQRYREVHDFWHVLTGVPTTVLGEIALKWFEMYQTGLPMTALSSVVGPLRLPVSEMRVLYGEYIPWAKRSATNATFLMNFYYERRLQDDLAAIRDELRLEPWHQHKHY